MCQPYVGQESVDQFRAEADRPLCKRSALTGKSLERVQHADIVIFASRWRDWSVERIAQTIEALAFKPTQQVIVVSRKSFEPDPQKYLQMPASSLASLRFKHNVNLTQKNAALHNALPPKVIYIDIMKSLCGYGQDCPVFTPQGQLISHDGMHLTQAGAAFLGTVLFSQPLLRPFAP